MHLTGVRKVVVQLVILTCKPEDLLDTERVVHGSVEVLDVRSLNGLLFVSQDSLHEVDGDRLVDWQVETTVHREQATIIESDVRRYTYLKISFLPLYFAAKDAALICPRAGPLRSACIAIDG